MLFCWCWQNCSSDHRMIWIKIEFDITLVFEYALGKLLIVLFISFLYLLSGEIQVHLFFWSFLNILFRRISCILAKIPHFWPLQQYIVLHVLFFPNLSIVITHHYNMIVGIISDDLPVRHRMSLSLIVPHACRYDSPSLSKVRVRYVNIEHCYPVRDTKDFCICFFRVVFMSNPTLLLALFSPLLNNI